MESLACWHTFAFALTTNEDDLQKELDKIEESIKEIENSIMYKKTRLLELIDRLEASVEDFNKYEQFILVQCQVLFRLRCSIIDISIQHCLKRVKDINCNQKYCTVDNNLKGNLVRLYRFITENYNQVEDSYLRASLGKLLNELHFLIHSCPNK